MEYNDYDLRLPGMIVRKEVVGTHIEPNSQAATTSLEIVVLPDSATALFRQKQKRYDSFFHQKTFGNQ